MRCLYILLVILAVLAPSVALAASTPAPVTTFRNYSTLQQLGAGPENTLLYKGRQIVAGSGGSTTVENLTFKAGANMAVVGNDTEKSVTFSAILPWETKTIPLESDQDVLIAYNDYFSGTVTITYVGANRLSVKSFTISASDGHTPISNDYLKLRSFFPNTNTLGVPYVKFVTGTTTTPHLYIPVTNTVAGGTLTVTFASDIGHPPFFMPASPYGTLGAATALTGL